MLWQTEGKARFGVDQAFYRPKSAVVRDLGVLAAAVYRAENGRLRALDAMTGCGVRALRYWLESGADWVWANDANPEQWIVRQNLHEAIATKRAQVTYLDANRLFLNCYSRQDCYDLIDVDSFGSPTPYLSTALWATRIGGLMYFTSTDGRTATGHLPENSLNVYGAYARCHPAAHEQGLRLLIGRVQQQAVAQERGVEPIFSLYAAATYRVMLRLVPRPMLTTQNYGFLGYCHRCGEYQVMSWRKLDQTCCACRGALTVTGPMWLGALHSPQWLQSMQALAQRWNWLERAELLGVMAREVDFPPYFYTLGEIGRRGKMDIPKRSHLMVALQERGYRAAATHINAQAIKTDADLNTCIVVGRSLGI